MANEENLVSFKDLTTEKQREIASMGGKASVKARRERKAMREQAELLLSLPLKDKNFKKKLRELGIDTENLDNQMAMIAQLWVKAMKGDISAFTALRDLVGEKPVEKVEVQGEINNPFKDLTTEELRKMINGELINSE